MGKVLFLLVSVLAIYLLVLEDNMRKKEAKAWTDHVCDPYTQEVIDVVSMAGDMGYFSGFIDSKLSEGIKRWKVFDLLEIHLKSTNYLHKLAHFSVFREQKEWEYQK